MRRIAFLGRGVHTLPSYRALLNALSVHHSITVYFEVNRDLSWLKHMHRYRIRSFSLPGATKRIQHILFLLQFFWDHLFHRYDLIHAHSTFPTGWVAILAGKIFHTPVIVGLDGGEGVSYPTIDFGDLRDPRRFSINKKVIQHSDLVLMLTQYQKSTFSPELMNGREPVLIPRGVNRQLFPFKSKNISVPLVVLHVGYLSSVKDPEMLLKTFQRLQESIPCILIQVGEDFSGGVVRQRAEQLNLSEKIQFIGPVSQEELVEFYHRSDFLLITSCFESQCVAVAEAMACGVVVCSTHVGLAADLSGTCCVTVPVGDDHALAAKVLALSADPVQYNYYRKNALEWSVQNDLIATAEAYQRLYNKLLDA